jgi:hypothetical protein
MTGLKAAHFDVPEGDSLEMDRGPR